MPLTIIIVILKIVQNNLLQYSTCLFTCILNHTAKLNTIHNVFLKVHDADEDNDYDVDDNDDTLKCILTREMAYIECTSFIESYGL